MTLMRAPDKIT